MNSFSFPLLLTTEALPPAYLKIQLIYRYASYLSAGRLSIPLHRLFITLIFCPPHPDPKRKRLGHFVFSGILSQTWQHKKLAPSNIFSSILKINHALNRVKSLPLRLRPLFIPFIVKLSSSYFTNGMTGKQNFSLLLTLVQSPLASLTAS